MLDLGFLEEIDTTDWSKEEIIDYINYMQAIENSNELESSKGLSF